MKSIVVFDEYNELDFKPADLLHEYIALVHQDVQTILIEGHQLKNIDCPACGHSKSKEAFERFGLTYRECGQCRSLYISPRPTDEALIRFFKTSAARSFWNRKLYSSTKRKREDKIIKPRFEWIADTTREYRPGAEHLVDINANQYGYIQELADTKVFSRRTVIDPLFSVDAATVSSGITIVDQPWSKAEIEVADVISLFEVLDRTADVNGLMHKVNAALSTGGLCFITSILGSGFDVQALWDKAEHLYPPDRLNVFSVEGLRRLFDRFGFECLEFSTPGMLDVDIVRRYCELNAEAEVSKFVQSIIHANEHVRRNFQEFLQANLLSSYGRIVIRKR